MAFLSALMTEIAIPVCAIIGIAFSAVLWCRNSDNCNNREQDSPLRLNVTAKCAEIEVPVFKGWKYFLSKECRYVVAFIATFAVLIFVLLGSVESFSTQSRPCKFDPSNTCKPALANAFFSTVSFLLGAFTSALSGLLGMIIAIYAKARTALEESESPGNTSVAAFRSGAVMGFFLAAVDLLVLYLALNLFKLYYGNDWEGLFVAITGYGLGGSSMALFGRAVGGIYAKAADVCVHLVKKIQSNFPEDNLNPAVITDYVGDIVGDIMGMGPDLFGSCTQSSCAALVVASISSFGIKHDFTAMCYPLLISSMGILICLITTVLVGIKPTWKKGQLFISTALMTVGIPIVTWLALPSSFIIYNFGSQKVVKNWQVSLCVGFGLWAGQFTELVNKYYTDDGYSNIQGDALKNISAALGFVRIPLLAAVSIFLSSHFAATYGIAVAALGMLSTKATRLAIEASCPISNNAKRIVEMTVTAGNAAAGNAAAGNTAAGVTAAVLAGNAAAGNTAAGNTAAGVTAPVLAGNTMASNTASAIGKGFAIESTALVSIALFGAFVSRLAMSSVDVRTPKVTIGLIMGAGLPYGFSTMTMKSVGRLGLEMAMKVCEQHGPALRDGHAVPDYTACFKISTKASFKGMIGPVVLVMFIPLIIGTVFGVEMLSGVLAGSLSSVVQIALSASKSDGAWSQAKDDIKVGVLEYAEKHCPRDSMPRIIAEEGMTIGDPWKDTSGPPLNILVQLMAVESLMFAPFFASHGGLLFKIH